MREDSLHFIVETGNAHKKKAVPTRRTAHKVIDFFYKSILRKAASSREFCESLPPAIFRKGISGYLGGVVVST